MPSITIVSANTLPQIGNARRLFLAYEKEIGVDLCFQGFAEELNYLPGKYGPPDGELLLAISEGHAVGCVALRRFSPSDAEMKRLYVQPSHRKFGVARQLAQRIIQRARELGYRRILLDTLDSMHAAQALYRSLGFVNIEPYYVNPLSGALYFAKDLSSVAAKSEE